MRATRQHKAAERQADPSRHGEDPPRSSRLQSLTLECESTLNHPHDWGNTVFFIPALPSSRVNRGGNLSSGFTKNFRKSSERRNGGQRPYYGVAQEGHRMNRQRNFYLGRCQRQATMQNCSLVRRHTRNNYSTMRRPSGRKTHYS